jgi:hypothetical protein
MRLVDELLRVAGIGRLVVERGVAHALRLEVLLDVAPEEVR